MELKTMIINKLITSISQMITVWYVSQMIVISIVGKENFSMASFVMSYVVITVVASMIYSKWIKKEDSDEIALINEDKE